MNSLTGENGWLPRGARFSAPCLSRLIYLYAYGYTTEAILEILQREFQDVEAYPITYENISRMISSNRDMLEEYKQTLVDELRRENKEYMKQLVEKGLSNDMRIAEALIKKEDELLDVMMATDLKSLDENGRPSEMGVFLATMAAIEKVNKLKGTLTGITAIRELDVYMRKEEIKKKINSNSDILPPPTKGREITHNGRPINLSE